MTAGEMVWVYSGWCNTNCPLCDGEMVGNDRGLECTSCSWPNDKAEG